MRVLKPLSFAAGLMLAASATVAASTPAQAHAVFVSGSPSVGAKVTNAPTSVTVTFDDKLVAVKGGNLIEVTDPAGKRVDSGATKLTGAVISVKLKALTKHGKYTVSYHVISDDGHPVTGSYAFYFAAKN